MTASAVEQRLQAWAILFQETFGLQKDVPSTCRLLLVGDLLLHCAMLAFLCQPCVARTHSCRQICKLRVCPLLTSPHQCHNNIDCPTACVPVQNYLRGPQSPTEAETCGPHSLSPSSRLQRGLSTHALQKNHNCTCHSQMLHLFEIISRHVAYSRCISCVIMVRSQHRKRIRQRAWRTRVPLCSWQRSPCTSPAHVRLEDVTPRPLPLLEASCWRAPYAAPGHAAGSLPHHTAGATSKSLLQQPPSIVTHYLSHLWDFDS